MPLTAGVNATGKHGEALPGARDVKVKVLVVVVLVGVVVAADSGTGFEVLASSLGSLLDLGGRVVVVTAGGVTLLDLGRDGGHDSGQGGNDDGGELHCGGGDEANETT